MAASDLQNLLARRSAIMAELAALSPTAAGGKPNITGGGMGTVDHVGYKAGLYKELEELNRLIDVAQGPFQLASRAY